jgi:ribonuclease III
MSESPLNNLIDELDCTGRSGKRWLQAVTHTSYAHEHNTAHNEQLEFIGDSLLDAAVALVLAKAYPNVNEGALSRMRAALVNDITLAEVGKEIGIPKCLRLGKGEAATKGSTKTSIIAGAFEAICFVIYEEDGFKGLVNVINSVFASRVKDVYNILNGFDPKSDLQELTQRRWKAAPTYTHYEGVHTSFRCEVKILDHVGRGTGQSKAEAEREAAKELIGVLKNV